MSYIYDLVDFRFITICLLIYLLGGAYIGFIIAKRFRGDEKYCRAPWTLEVVCILRHTFLWPLMSMWIWHTGEHARVLGLSRKPSIFDLFDEDDRDG